ncbi:hypothetical protein FP435_03470 [Lactobacillus sp. PV037]|uniref:zinc-ribbon domain-containing protein n=1 Tax=Lactobacillus sp. PV037 TaxID=2594496 RepID=UPI002240131B|nr:zinc-ribbon domain-containing protein [Lactobacillus sp. PV037]QNQ83568.1 hypothetical protein FP435_03470 [Lactobacillus sp. PV037]
MKKFCTNCGHPLKPTDKVCGNCGQVTNNSQNSPTAPNPKPLKSKKKKIKYLIYIGILVIVAALGFAGTKYYSQDSQASRIVNALTTNSPKLKNYVITDNSTVKITPETLKPLQTSYEYLNKSDKKSLKDYLVNSLKQPNSKETLQLVRNGNYFMIFPKYSLKVRTYSPVINTDDDNDLLYINGTNMGKIKSNGKKQVNLLAGMYDITVYNKQKQETNKTVDIVNNDPVFLDVKTYSVKIKGPAYSKIYFNGIHEKEGTLDKNGETIRTYFRGGNDESSSSSHKKYDPDEDGEFYLTTVVDGKTVKSKPIKGLIDQLADFNTYGANSDSGVIKWSSDDDDFDYIVTPKWDTDVDVK